MMCPVISKPLLMFPIKESLDLYQRSKYKEVRSYGEYVFRKFGLGSLSLRAGGNLKFMVLEIFLGSFVYSTDLAWP